jgi:hypothetical protein
MPEINGQNDVQIDPTPEPAPTTEFSDEFPFEPTLAEKRVEIVLDACSIRGTLTTSQTRVSDHLNASDAPVYLRDARVVTREGQPLANQTTVYVNKSVILFVVDLTPNPTGQLGFQVERDPRNVTLNLGTIWIRGEAHLPIGGEMEAYFGGASAGFMPLTNATVVGPGATAPRTVLINRSQLRCMMAESE